MVELGMAIVAACLPTLRPLFNNLSSESLSKAVRSFFSARSLSSNFSSKHKHSKDEKHSDSASNSSYNQFADKVGMRIENVTDIYALGDLESQSAVEPGKVMVRNEVLLS